MPPMTLEEEVVGGLWETVGHQLEETSDSPSCPACVDSETGRICPWGTPG